MRSRAAARAAAPFENVGGVRVERGGITGYRHVRGRQGRGKNLFQGFTPKKGHRTALYASAKEAAVAFAKKQFVGLMQKDAVAVQPAAAPTLAPMGGVTPATTSARLMPLVQCPSVIPLSLQWSPQPALPVVRCVLLTREQAAAAASRGVALAMAE